MQEFTATGNERERRFVHVIVKNARENKPWRGREKKRRKRKRAWEEVNQVAEREQDILVCPLEIYKQYFSDWREGGGNLCCDLYREPNSFRFFLRLL